MSKQKKIILGVVALVAVVALLLGVYFATRPEAVDGAKALTITVVHGDGSEKVFDVHTDSENLEGALLENDIVEDNQTEWGLYILTADGETADESQQQWWCVTKGGEMLTTGATDTMIADGESYELTLTVGYE